MIISVFKYCLIFAFYFLFVINFQTLMGYKNLNLIHNFADILDFILILSVLFSIIFLTIYLVSLKYITKLFSSIILIPSSFFSYAILNYNVDLNNENIIGSIFETKIPEVISFFLSINI